ncbi:biotin-dependent carboxyltransferase family protein [Evansella tamaricis]|uniref:Biotin-dependent carboxyltransferase family protein n=1 Tax=Evansella tamaricis TaxID=2069301 RepID=A0ABS6JL06_9BACI|nr:biotin-dependent carboxyltransferase family protein [Evansella tamaricis]MBU9714359.1 biotin-dependent carboxyltransferase family protein [Evansella tamaricis]
MKMFEVVDPGLHTTIQDLGRTGFQHVGISPAGAMDDFAFQLGNLLLGNERNAAGLEMTMLGPSLRALQSSIIVLSGADLTPTIDGKEIPMWRPVMVLKGQLLCFERPRYGARTYLTILGGIQVPIVLGSKSTYVKGKFGGMEGRALEEGDVIEGEDSLRSSTISEIWGKLRKLQLSASVIPNYPLVGRIRVISGPQDHFFMKETLDVFYRSRFKITNQSDRMGYRLQAFKVTRDSLPVSLSIPYKENREMLTDIVTKGSIQVPGNGKPILLMADRQTSGGYPKIANVISVDLWKVAQLLPGQEIHFEKTSVEAAQQEFRKREYLFQQIEIYLRLQRQMTGGKIN